MSSRWKDFGAMLLIGDGMMALIRPRRYTSEWEIGPSEWRSLMRFLNERPNLTRALGAIELAGGLVLALSRDESEAVV
ncbi:MAG TPA: hypothetical protein VMA71_06155 [Alloacidobacterium sp.]|nr:hypothetical protein [Alloacidobacterium sp.]